MGDIQSNRSNELLIVKKQIEIDKQKLVLNEYNYKIMLARDEISKIEKNMQVSKDYINKLTLELGELKKPTASVNK